MRLASGQELSAFDGRSLLGDSRRLARTSALGLRSAAGGLGFSCARRRLGAILACLQRKSRERGQRETNNEFFHEYGSTPAS